MNNVFDNQVHYRTCNLCDAMCGLEIKHKDGQVLSIKGNKGDIFSHGHICPKAVALQDIHSDADRVRQPLRRTADGWEPIAWDEAYQEISENIQGIQKQYGQDAVSFFYGTPMAQDYGAQIMMGALKAALGSKNYFSSISLDSLPLMFNGLQLFGNQALIPVPDIQRTQCLVCLGGNPLVSNGSAMASGDLAGKIKALKKRDGDFIVIDPRFTESAKVATQHIFIKPGTDVYLLLALIHLVFTDYPEKVDKLPSYIKHVDLIEELTKSYSPERVASVTGIDAADIRALGNKFCRSPSASMYSRMGICATEFSSLTNLLITVFNIITGNFDKAGGVMFTKPAVDLPGIAKLSGVTGSFSEYKSRVSGLSEFEGELPAVTFSEEVLTKGKGQIKALITWGANIALSVPDGKKTERALDQLDYMVAIDFYINETTKHANIILPPVSPLQRSHFTLATTVVATRNIAKYSPPLFSNEDKTRDDWQILFELSMGIMADNPVKSVFTKGLNALMVKIGVDSIINILLAIGPYGKLSINTSGNKLFEIVKLFLKAPLLLVPRLLKGVNIAQLKNSNDGVDFGQLKPCMPERLSTPDGKIDLLPDIYRAQIKALESNLENRTNAAEQFLLIGRRDLRSHNSWLHNSKRLVKGKSRCTAIINTLDAAELRVVGGDMVTVFTDLGEVVLPVSIGDDIMRGVISVPHGWGHDRAGVQLRNATEATGVAINDIIDGKYFDSITGMSLLYGLPVQLKKANIVGHDCEVLAM